MVCAILFFQVCCLPKCEGQWWVRKLQKLRGWGIGLEEPERPP